MQALKHEASYYQTTKFKWRQRIGFGISDYACNLAYLLSNTYLLFYYTNCAGIDAGAAGFMLVITKFVDAFTDYMVGYLIDRTDTKMGRYRPWMLIGAPVLAVGMVLLFSVPVAWGAGAKMVWAYCTYILMSFGYTMVNIPMAPIVSALSPEPAERTKIATSRTVFSNLGSLTASLFTLPMVYHFAGAANADAFAAADAAAKATGYRNTNIVLGLMVVAIMCICVFSIVEINPPTKAENTQKSSFIQELGQTFQSKYFIMILILCYCLFVGYLGMYAAMQYYYTYVIGDASGMPIALTLLTVCAIPTMLLAAALNGKGVAKVKLMQLGTLIDIAGYAILFLSANATIATCALALVGIGFGFRQSMYFSILPDVFDYTEWKVGKNMGGTQNAISGFLNKLASASASAIISALLVACAYQENIAAMDALVASGQNIAAQFPQINSSLNFAFGGLSLIATILCFLVLLPYDLDKKMPQIRADLDARATSKS